MPTIPLVINFSWRFSLEKCQTITVARLFYRQTTQLTLYVPLCSTGFIQFRVNLAVAGSSPCFNKKVFRTFEKPDETSMFFDTVRLLSNFLSPMGPIFNCFDIFQETGLSKSPKGLLILIFKHYETVSNFSFFVCV